MVWSVKIDPELWTAIGVFGSGHSRVMLGNCDKGLPSKPSRASPAIRQFVSSASSGRNTPYPGKEGKQVWGKDAAWLIWTQKGAKVLEVAASASRGGEARPRVLFFFCSLLSVVIKSSFSLLPSEKARINERKNGLFGKWIFFLKKQPLYS